MVVSKGLRNYSNKFASNFSRFEDLLKIVVFNNNKIIKF